MEDWQRQLAASLTDPRRLAERFGIDPRPLADVVRHYPMRITPHYLGLIHEPGDPIWRQCVPDVLELADETGLMDPLAEENLSPVPSLVHRYPDRALLLVSGACAVYCRFCTRKRKVGCALMAGISTQVGAGIAYIAENPGIRDVLISGGEPLLLSDAELDAILQRLRRIPHVETVRIGTRVPVTLPQRITESLCGVLRRHQPLFVNTHFNHPREITAEAAQACARLAEAGIVLGNQTVLLRGVNDDPAVMAELLRGLLRLRVRPYYLHHMDVVRGGGHFRTRIETGLEIMRSLRGTVSGLAIPHYVVDLPGGKGKVPLLPEYLESLGETAILVSPRGERVAVPNED